ncbi:MAG: hypothetical protein ACR2NZ_11260 [Rubripirellula sp.]
MSQFPTSSPDLNERRKSNSTVLWIAASFLLSGCILAWAFSAPFRDHGRSGVIASSSDRGATEIADQTNSRRFHSETVRADAIAKDRKFMKALAKQRALDFPKVPGEVEVRENWVRRVNRAKREIDSLRAAKPGSIEQERRQELGEKLRDAPVE